MNFVRTSLRPLLRSFPMRWLLNASACTWSATRLYLSREDTPRCLGNAPCRGAVPPVGYWKVHQVGSHMILETSEPAHQRMAIPDHNPLRIGTFSSILKAIAKYE